ncbi:hypothetical protein ONZ43_g6907 [Nemania bipapillata]|uniref:Uncharacterized protein n=1 Tax=Nemania bipapillata TaxID=110536 RepID=A0ACC2HUY1_9PEZI|nr:hypothetical protein ONZ43_g6907 [Nemania bipapillata]
MQLYLSQAILMTGAIAAWLDPRQVIVTVTAGVPVSAPSAPSPVPLTAPPVPWEQPPGASESGSAPVVIPGSTSLSTTSGGLSLPPLQPAPASTAPGPVISASGGAKCGKGYTYCGYMLTGGGHNFAQSDIQRSYCNGLPELCVGGKEKTNAEQAVFVCLSDQPATVQLLCACSGTCLNNATTNYIAHCDKACVNN